MRDQPDNRVLLEAARDALVSGVLPHLDGEARGTALMVARALSVIDRRIEAAEAEIEEGRALAALLGVPSAADTPTAAHAGRHCDDLGVTLVRAIRAARIDEEVHFDGPLLAFLLMHVRKKVAENNPKSLQNHDGIRTEPR